MSVGVYAMTYPKNMGTLKYGMEIASWVSIETGSDAPIARSKIPAGIQLNKWHTLFPFVGKIIYIIKVNKGISL